MHHCSLTVAQALLNKVDWKIMLMAAISFSALNLDRSNINQANSAGFLSDLGLTTDGNHSSLSLTCVVNDRDHFGTRFQPWEHHFSPFLPVCRVAISADFEACGSIPMVPVLVLS